MSDDKKQTRVILDDADHPPVERGVYYIGYCELVDGYRHAFYDHARRRVRYSRNPSHPSDPRCPACAERVSSAEPRRDHVKRQDITDDERAVLNRLRLMALNEGFETPPVREERYRIAEWVEQTLDEGWLPAEPGGNR